MLSQLPQNLVFGLLVGGLYGLAAVGLSLVFGVTKILNVSHGELLMLGGYAGFWLFTLFGVDPFLGLPVAILLLVLLGLFLYKAVFGRMTKLGEESKIKNTMLVGFGLGIVFQNVAQRLWTADQRGITTDYSSLAFTLFGVRFPIVRVASFLIALFVLVALHLFLKRTYFGKAIRATVQDWEAAALLGISKVFARPARSAGRTVPAKPFPWATRGCTTATRPGSWIQGAAPVLTLPTRRARCATAA
jgi:branched-chain amino acid transport system permease protein